jgi:hypothetical protein
MGLWALFLVMASSTRTVPLGNSTVLCPARSSRRRRFSTFRSLTSVRTTRSVRSEIACERAFPSTSRFVRRPVSVRYWPGAHDKRGTGCCLQVLHGLRDRVSVWHGRLLALCGFEIPTRASIQCPRRISSVEFIRGSVPWGSRSRITEVPLQFLLAAHRVLGE